MNKVGYLGEKIAAEFLKRKGYEVLEKNLWFKRYGEIDIIAKKNNIYYFIEVKTLKTNKNYDPSWHYTNKKTKKFHNLINYLVNKNRIDEFKTLLITVSLGKKVKIKVYENV